MTSERLNKEMLYQVSLAPFKVLLSQSVISGEDYRVIDTILRSKYNPVFVGESYQIPLDK